MDFSAITGRRLPTEKEKFRASRWVAEQMRLPSPGERVPGVWPLEMTPKKWIDRSAPGYTASLFNPPKMVDPIAGMVDFKGFKPKTTLDQLIGNTESVLPRNVLEKLRKAGWKWTSASVEQAPKLGSRPHKMWRMIEPTPGVKRPVILKPPETGSGMSVLRP